MKIRLLIAFASIVVGLSACSDSADEVATTAPPLTNACPVEGCSITITDVSSDDGELRVTWEANFAPDFTKNHIHLFWDTYSVEQVSGNAESEYGVTQGNWLPTDAFPSVLTEGAVSVSAREGSTTLCVTAADFVHNVLDTSLVTCTDVSDSL